MGPAGAAVAVAGAAANAAELEDRASAPALIEARAQTLLIGMLRLILAAGGLAAMALLLDPALAALLAGILAGLGGAALGFGAQLAAWERQRGARVLAEPGRRGRIFEVPQ